MKVFRRKVAEVNVKMSEHIDDDEFTVSGACLSMQRVYSSEDLMQI